MDNEERRVERRPPRLLTHPVYLSLLAGISLAAAMLATMFSWTAAAVACLVFLFAAGRWTWTMRDGFASMLADAERPADAETRER